MFCSGLDFNFRQRGCDPAKAIFAGIAYACRQAGFCTADRAFAADHISPVCGAVCGRAQDQELHLSRAVSVLGVCSTDLPGKLARYRSVPASATRRALSHGHSQIVPIADSSLLSAKIIKGAVLKVYKGASHGLCTTLKSQVNEDLLAFINA